ncbi:MAG: MBL fold metallo-hydrolase [Chloroherpetonaceae bacterium]|nr:MBL fold metallo-hydrolase [Chloroherpetonaceae bacterium]
MKIKGYTLSPILCENFALDGGAMFGTVPKVLWEKAIPPDEKNRIDMAARALLISGNGKNILVDTGMGQKWEPKFREMFKVSESFLELNLKSHGISPADITDVILTHLHFDHAGGAVKRNEQGSLVPTFPNATYYVQEDNYKWALNPNAREKASYLKENFLPLMEIGILKFTSGEFELFEGVHLIRSEAHTRAQQLVKVTDEKNSLLYCGDVIPTHAHIPLPWVMGYDLYPLEIMEEKKKLLEQAADEGWVLFFEHEPIKEAATVVKSEKGIISNKHYSFAVN